MNKRRYIQLMHPQEVARLLGCHPQTVTAMQRAGRLSPVKTPLGVRFDALEVLAVWRAGKPWQGSWSKESTPC